MTRDEIETLAWQVFATAFTREAHLPPDERGKAALRAARRVDSPARPDNAGIRAAIELRREPTRLDEVRDARARRVIAAVALRHDTTSADVLGPGRAAETVLARDEAAWELARGEHPMSLRVIASVFGRSHERIRQWVARHEAKVERTMERIAEVNR